MPFTTLAVYGLAVPWGWSCADSCQEACRCGTSVALRVGVETLLFGVPEDTQRQLLAAPQVLTNLRVLTAHAGVAVCTHLQT